MPHMFHPIFMAALKRPDLIFRHLANYAELIKEDLASQGKQLALRAACGLVALLFLFLALGLTGVSVMLGVLNGAFHWGLILVPAVAWVVAVLAGLVAMRSTLRRDIQGMQAEVQADLGMLNLAKDMKQ